VKNREEIEGVLHPEKIIVSLLSIEEMKINLDQ